jgi:FtsZ-binding cell division protein ZapB
MKTKKTKLELLNERSQNAINLVVATIEQLKGTNQSIDDEYHKNSETIASIENTNRSLNELKRSNEKIISNFENLLK